MPYPSEHAARIKNPSEFISDSFRRKVISRGVIIIMARTKDKPDEMIVQAYRFDIKYFTAAQAKDWLKEHDITYLSFEPAKEPVETNDNSNKIDEYRYDADLKYEFRCIVDKSYTNRSVFNDDGDEQIYVSGIGIVYNSSTELYPGVYESIEPGAFSESLSKNNTVKSFINHNPTKILATTRSNPPLEILDGENFLEFSAPIVPTTYGNDLIINLKRGNINGASFSFTISENGDHYKKRSDGSLHRIITKAEIYEVGPVTNPAYTQTEVGLRNKEFFDKVKSSLITKNHDDIELKNIQEFLSKRKGL